MLKVRIKLFFNIPDFTYEKKRDLEVEFSDESNILNLLMKIGIPKNIPIMVLVNGKPPSSLDERLKNGDIVVIFPPMAGG